MALAYDLRMSTHDRCLPVAVATQTTSGCSRTTLDWVMPAR
jgi:hypothetical protein